jgi:hypothetical protein
MSLFNNIRTVPQGGTKQADIANIVQRITIFIVRRCAPIISHRLRSDKFIFRDTTLDKILQGWKPSDRDHFVKTECEISQHLVPLFQRWASTMSTVQWEIFRTMDEGDSSSLDANISIVSIIVQGLFQARRREGGRQHHQGCGCL